MTSSWVPGSDEGFTLDNLPYGIFAAGSGAPRAGVAIGSAILDLDELQRAGLLNGLLPEGVFAQGSLNEFLSLGRSVWTPVRARVTELLSDGNDHVQALAPHALVPMKDARVMLPVQVGDYVDFYSSISHATNLGRMFRPDQEALLPNWRHLPVGYHGRAGTIVVSGTDIVRPSGQRKTPDTAPVFAPTTRLDFELEIGFVTGPGNALGEPIPIERAEDHIFGLVLVNDWSARDIQAWEYVPLGPFLGKSFATSISPWIVPLEALAPYRVSAPAQEPQPLAHLRRNGDTTLDIDLDVHLIVDGEATRISRTNARGLYWTMAQQLAHATSGGATCRPGDLFASGTISGDEHGTYGSMIELTWNGAEPVKLAGGQTRAFLEDGDTVVMSGSCGRSISFGDVRGTILPATM